MTLRLERICFWAVVTMSGCLGRLPEAETNQTSPALRPVIASQLRGRIARTGTLRRFSQFQYDALGRPVSEVHFLDGASYAYTFDYGYAGGLGAAGELGSRQRLVVFPDGEHVLRAFDAGGREQKVSSKLAIPTRSPRRDADAIVQRHKLNRWGQLEWKEHGDQTRTWYGYLPTRQLRYVLTQKSSTGEILQGFGYTYDRVGRITSVQDFCVQMSSGFSCCDPRQASCSEGPLSASYEYDAAGTLTHMRSAQGTQTFKADAIGNLVSKNNHLQLYETVHQPHAVSEVTDVHGQTVGLYRYNRIGAMVSMQENATLSTLTWNANNLPIRIQTQSQLSERFYVGESMVKRLDTSQGQTTTTLFLPNLRIEDGVFRKSYGEDAERESTVTQTRGQLRFFHPDHLGSSTLVTDEQGNPVWRAAYFPYGEMRFSEGAFTPKKQFTGKEPDAFSGLYDFHARLYNPRLGRFLSADSLMDGLNPYSYVHNNPMNWVDPSGHAACDRDASGRCVSSEEPVLKFEAEHGTTMQAYVPPWHDRALDLMRTAREEFLRRGASGVQWGFDRAYQGGRIAHSGNLDERLDLAGLSVGFVPYVGDFGSLAISGVQLYRHPTGANLVNLGLDGVGSLLPLVGAMGTLRRIERRETDGSLVNVIIDFNSDDRFNRVSEKLIGRFIKGQEGYDGYTTVIFAHGRLERVVPGGPKVYTGISANGRVLETPWEVSNWLPSYRGPPGTEKICIFACGIGSTHLPQGLANIRNAPVTVFPGALPKTFNQGVTFLPDNYFRKGVRPPPR